MVAMIESFMENYKKIKISLSIILLKRILFFFLILIQVVIGSSMVRSNERVSIFYFDVYLRFFGLFIICLLLFISDFTKRELLVYFFICILLQVISLRTRFMNQAIYLLATSMVVKNEKEDWILKAFMKSVLISVLIVFLLYIFEIIPPRMTERWDGTIRNSLGFWHPNTTGALFLSLLLSFVANKNNRIKLLTLFVWGTSFLIINYFTDSSTSIILVSLIILYVLFLSFTSNFENILILITLKIFNYLVPFLLIFSYLISYFYNPENFLLRSLNHFVTSRIVFGQVFVREYPLSLFGRNLVFSSPNTIGANIAETGHRVLDNGYLHTLLSHGIIYTVLILFAFILIINKLYRRGFKYMPLAGIIIALYGFTEMNFLILPFNFVLLLGGRVLKIYLEDFGLDE